MLSSKRKIKKKTGLFLAFIFTTSFSAFAGQDINLTANVKNSTCQSGISNQGNIDLGVVGVGYFAGNISPESYQPGGGNDSNLLIVFYVQIMPDDFVMQLHRF